VGGNKQTPLSAVVFQNSQPVFDPNNFNRPLLQPVVGPGGQPLFCAAYYEEQLPAVHGQILAAQDRFQKLLVQEQGISDKIIGPKGMRELLSRENAKTASVEAEIRDLNPQLLYDDGEADALGARNAQLRKRVEELQKARGPGSDKL
jgi:hypothetical protein